MTRNSKNVKKHCSMPQPSETNMKQKVRQISNVFRRRGKRFEDIKVNMYVYYQSEGLITWITPKKLLLASVSFSMN